MSDKHANKLRSLKGPGDFKEELADLALVIPGDYKADDLVGRAKELHTATDKHTKTRVNDVLKAFRGTDKSKFNQKDVESFDTLRVFDLAVLQSLEATNKKDLKDALEIFNREMEYEEGEFRMFMGLSAGQPLVTPLTDTHKTAFDHYLAKALPTPSLDKKSAVYINAVLTEIGRLGALIDPALFKKIQDRILLDKAVFSELLAHKKSYDTKGHAHQALSGTTSSKVNKLVGHHLEYAAGKRVAHGKNVSDLKAETDRHEGIQKGDRLFGDALTKATDDIRKMLGVMRDRGSTVNADAINDRVGKLKGSRDAKIAELDKRRAEVIRVKRGKMNKDIASAYGLLFHYSTVQNSQAINKLYENITGSLDIFGDFIEDIHACLVAKRERNTCVPEWTALMTKIMAKYKHEKEGAAIRLKYSGAEKYSEGSARHFEAELEPYFELIEQWDPKDAILLEVSYVSIGALIGKIVPKDLLGKMQKQDTDGKFPQAVGALSDALNQSIPCTAEIIYGDGTTEVKTFKKGDPSSFDTAKCGEFGVFGLKIREVKAAAQLLDDMNASMAIELKPFGTLDDSPVPNATRALIRGRKNANIDIVYLDAKNKVLKIDEDINTDVEDSREMKFVLDHMDINAELLRVSKDKKGWLGGQYIETSALAA